MLIGIAIGFFVGLLPGIGGLSDTGADAALSPIPSKIRFPRLHSSRHARRHRNNRRSDFDFVRYSGRGIFCGAYTDGYPMTKNGEAGRALGAAITGSVLGAIIGALSFALIDTDYASAGTLFGSPELFIIAIMGITFIGTLAGASLIKGLLAGGLGLMLAAIGVDPQTGSFVILSAHCTCGIASTSSPWSWACSLFPEIVDLAVRGTSIAGGKPDKLTGVMEGVKDTFVISGWSSAVV